MARSLNTVRQEWRGGMSLGLVLALLLPLLLGVLPLPALGQTAALERDIAASTCAQPGEDGQAPDHADHDACCILCPSGTPGAATLKSSPHIIVPPARIAFGAGVIAERAVPVHRIDLTQIVPRGPPAA